MYGLNNLAKGSLEERVEWIWELYDQEGKGSLSLPELHKIIASIYSLLGPNVDQPPDHFSQRRHTTDVFAVMAVNISSTSRHGYESSGFQKMDVNQDGVISRAEFFQVCLSDPVISKSLRGFDDLPITA